MFVDANPHFVIDILPEEPKLSKLQQALAEKVESAASAFHQYSASKPASVVVEVAPPKPQEKPPASPFNGFDQEIFIDDEDSDFGCVVS